ncbi:MAG: hypothetical protein ABIG96_03650 [Candidatus Micrarchaeota archaeon]
MATPLEVPMAYDREAKKFIIGRHPGLAGKLESEMLFSPHGMGTSINFPGVLLKVRLTKFIPELKKIAEQAVGGRMLDHRVEIDGGKISAYFHKLGGEKGCEP